MKNKGNLMYCMLWNMTYILMMSNLKGLIYAEDDDLGYSVKKEVLRKWDGNINISDILAFWPDCGKRTSVLITTTGIYVKPKGRKCKYLSYHWVEDVKYNRGQLVFKEGGKLFSIKLKAEVAHKLEEIFLKLSAEGMWWFKRVDWPFDEKRSGVVYGNKHSKLEEIFDSALSPSPSGKLCKKKATSEEERMKSLAYIRARRKMGEKELREQLALYFS